MDLLTIGAFARLARLSPKALRRYDEQGLLAPASVDPDTGYRWYHPDQVARARSVALLRQLDMPLARIARTLDLDGPQRAAALAEFWAEQEQGMAARRELARFLIDQLTGKATTMTDVTVREVPARTLLTVTETLTAPEIGAFAGPLFGLFGGPTVARPHGVSGRPFLRYQGEVTADSDGPVEFCCPVEDTELTATAARFPDMTTRTEPAGREVYVTVTKAQMTTSLAFEQLHQWVTEHDTPVEWTPRQIFLTDPASAAAEDPVFELAVPLR